jgi:hypothetical protein
MCFLLGFEELDGLRDYWEAVLCVIRDNDRCGCSFQDDDMEILCMYIVAKHPELNMP